MTSACMRWTRVPTCTLVLLVGSCLSHVRAFQTVTSKGVDGPAPTRQELTNCGDLLYTVDITVGGQVIKSIPDSGSFDLLVFSTHCENCGDVNLLYDDAKSTSYVNGSFDAVQEFGSGSTTSIEAFDQVQLGTLASEKQVFWEVVKAGYGFGDSSFQSIFGIGPPASVVKIADKEAKDVKDRANWNGQAGESVIEHYQEVAKHVRSQVAFLERTQTKSYSICLRPEAGSSGVIIWNDDSVSKHPKFFTTIPVVGDMYWSVPLQDVGLVAMEGLDGATSVGCGSSQCNAVIDSGTSLLVVPYAAYDAIGDAIDRLGKKVDVCSDLSQLPNLEFKLGGAKFSLGPESYMGNMHGDVPKELLDYMPRAKMASGSQSCVPLLMTCEEKSDEGELWILGLPFFRKYYSNFHLSDDSKVAKTVSFAEADEGCNPTSSEVLTRMRPAATRAMSVDATRIRPPTWLPLKKRAA